jgi:multidrug efflux system outer membrane protein
LEAERRILVNTIETYRRSLELTQNRRRGGIVTDLDVSEAETQLRSAEAQLPAIDLQHDNLAHALATLCGQAATGFEVDSPAKAGTPNEEFPSVPGGLPSELLERRPDVAAAERRMAAANAEIGVATSAFYPRVVFNGLAGFQSVNAGAFFDWPSRLWAIGPSLELPLFTGGRNRAQLTLTRKVYDEAVANYRQSVLTAFQEVEDQLAAQHLLATELQADSAALASARRTLEIANNRYKAGLVTYLEVAIAQSAALVQERTVVELEGERRMAVIRLIKALGGTWTGEEASNR